MRHGSAFEGMLGCSNIYGPKYVPITIEVLDKCGCFTIISVTGKFVISLNLIYMEILDHLVYLQLHVALPILYFLLMHL